MPTTLGPMLRIHEVCQVTGLTKNSISTYSCATGDSPREASRSQGKALAGNRYSRVA